MDCLAVNLILGADGYPALNDTPRHDFHRASLKQAGVRSINPNGIDADDAGRRRHWMVLAYHHAFDRADD